MKVSAPPDASTDHMPDIAEARGEKTLSPSPWSSWWRDTFAKWGYLITPHRLSVVLYIVLAVTLVRLTQSLLTSGSSEALYRHDVVWSRLGMSWLLFLPAACAWIAGALLFQHDDDTSLANVRPVSRCVVFRIVSRGTNVDCLLATIARCNAEMARTPLFPYLIHVVTDANSVDLPINTSNSIVINFDDVIHNKHNNNDYQGLVFHTRVPSWYTTPNKARFKARALHYAAKTAVDCFGIPDDAWIVHLDEETRPTSNAIKGIAKHIAGVERPHWGTGTQLLQRQMNDDEEKREDERKEEERAMIQSKPPPIGQGMLVYHRGWQRHPLMTLADMRRTGEDVGPYFLQHWIGTPIFGVHGSFLLVRADVERALGFDVGPLGSVAEDAWWILVAMSSGVRTSWVSGCMEEQAPQTFRDFLHQRQRWYAGLCFTAFLCPVHLRYRLVLLFNVVTWTLVPCLVPIQIIYMTITLNQHRYIWPGLRIIADLILVISVATYLSGLIINLREHGTTRVRAIIWVVLIILFMPVFWVMEAAGTIFGFLSLFSSTSRNFYVIQKSLQCPTEYSSVFQTSHTQYGAV